MTDDDPFHDGLTQGAPQTTYGEARVQGGELMRHAVLPSFLVPDVASEYEIQACNL